MKKIIVVLSIVLLSGCSTVESIKSYWPKIHDPVLFDQLVTVDIMIDHINCATPNWDVIVVATEKLARYTEWRKDPQAPNLQGLAKHVRKMSEGGSKMFCEIGKTAAQQRINAANTAWRGR